MTTHQSIATVTAMFAQRVQDYAMRAVDGVSVSMARPDAATGNGSDAAVSRVNLFLFQVGLDPHWRNEDLPTRSSAGSVATTPRVALQLHYLLTFYGDDLTLVPQRMLAAVIAGLHARPSFSMQAAADFIADNQPGEGDPPYEFLNDSLLHRQGHPVRLNPTNLSLEELSKLWSVFFQVPYALSVAYTASVVLIEAPEPSTVAPLPVRVPSVDVSGNYLPIRLTRVTVGGSTAQPVFADSVLRVEGSGLQGQGLAVRVGGTSIAQDPSEPGVMLADLSAFTLGAGVHLVQITRGSTSSNPLGFLLRPRVLTAESVEPAEEGEPAMLVVTSDLQAEPDQQVELLLNGLGGDRASYVLTPLPSATPTSTFTADPTGLPPGDYLVRIRIDGTASLLSTGNAPADWSWTGPSVTLP
jgi:hypothetical protein